MGRPETYDPIDDWSPEGRRLLVATRGDEIRALLDLAFTDFVDAQAIGLSTFGFDADDPVAEAVEWSLERFASSDLDPAKLHPASRSFRLFTEARFWLCQKVGRAAYHRILVAARSVVAPGQEAVDSGGEQDGSFDATIATFGHELALTLRGLGARTCADIVGYWLEGTKVLRREWFGWREGGHISEVGPGLSKKQRSFYAHDAMFRFLCCLRELVPMEPAAAAERAFVLTTLSPCENVPPYRIPDREVVSRLVGSGVKGSREVAQLRKEGACLSLRRCLERASAAAAGEPSAGLCAVLTHRSLGPTTLHALGIEGDPELRDQINALYVSLKEGA